ncbi:MAG: 3'-5' exonuclease [Kiritimatiellae bacterium]|nr:3'-5' exonuclease [Kiritimatiellia bacterium]
MSATQATLPPGLVLDRPLVFFDLEATGLNKRLDRIVSIALVRFAPDAPPEQHYYLLNPQIAIPAEASAIHGITDEDVADAPTFPELAPTLLRHFQNADLAGYYIVGYDIPLLQEEFARAGHRFEIGSRRILDVQKIYFRREPRDLSAAVRFYCGHEMENAHDALADILATVEVFSGQFRRYGDLPLDMDALNAYCDQRDPTWVDRSGRLRWVNGQVTLNFGRFQGLVLRDVIRNDPNLVAWILKSDFPADTKEIVRRARDTGVYPAPPAH